MKPFTVSVVLVMTASVIFTCAALASDYIANHYTPKMACKSA